MDINLHTNTDNIELCDKIQLSKFVRIQPYGVLLVLDKNLNVLQYSENIKTILDVTTEEIVNQPLLSFIKLKNNQEDIHTWLMKANKQYKNLHWQSKGSKLEIFAYIHQQTDKIILEIEKYTEEKSTNLLNLTQFTVSKLDKATDYQNIEESYARILCMRVRRQQFDPYLFFSQIQRSHQQI